MSGSSSTMPIIEEVVENKFVVEVNPSSAYLGVEVDGTSKGATSCSGLQSTDSLIFRWKLGHISSVLNSK